MDYQDEGYRSKVMELDLSSIEQAAKVHRALGSELRLEILRVGLDGGYNVNELAEMLHIPASTAALNIRVLEDAGLIITEHRPGNRGMAKVCNKLIDTVTIHLVDPNMFPEHNHNYHTYSLAIGSYWECCPFEYCGMLDLHGTIGRTNYPQTFYSLDRQNAQLIWFRYGYLEYRVSTLDLVNQEPDSLRISFEACSEVANYNMDWPSDIYVSVNGIELGIWTCPGDFGDRRGALTPEWWDLGSTQYGQLKVWSVDASGTTLDGKPLSGVTIADLHLNAQDYFTVRIGVHKHAKNVGGINLFGRGFGDHPQEIQVQVGCIYKGL